MSFNPDNYDLKKLSEYPLITFGNDLPDAAFMPVVSLDENDALANYKISLAQLRDFIIQVGDYTNVIDYRPQTYYTLDGMQLTIPGRWRLEVPNGFLPTGEYQNEILTITDARVIDFAQQGAGQWVAFLTADQTYILAKSELLVRTDRTKVTAPLTGVICYESDTNTWWRWTGTDWQQLIGMPLLNVTSTGTELTVKLCNSLMRNRLNLEYLLAQAGIEIPESRGPFERIITNVKKSGAELLYYIPAHTEVDLTNYPDTLNLITGAYARAVAAGALSFNVNEIEYQFYRDIETGLDFALDLTTYSTHYDNLGLAPFIYYDGDKHIWTPKTSHGEIVYRYAQPKFNQFGTIYADGWLEQHGIAGGNTTFLIPYEDGNRVLVQLTPRNSTEKGEGIMNAYNITATSFNTAISISTNGMTGSVSWTAIGYGNYAALKNYPNTDSYNEYYLLGNVARSIPVDLAGQLATILNNYAEIVQNQANYFSIKATDDADALQKSIENPNKFVYTADS